MIDRRYLLGAALGLPAAYMLWPRPSETTLPSDLFVQPANAAEGELLPDMTQGAEDAPIEVIEYASFTCPHCATFHKDVLPKLKANYVETGKARFTLVSEIASGGKPAATFEGDYAVLRPRT